MNIFMGIITGFLLRTSTMLKSSVWVSLFLALQVSAQEYSPALNIQHADNLYWGDLHVHSNLSPDSFAFGNARLTTNDAMRFAKGHPVKANSGQVAQLRRPLDFLLVADHAEFIGVFPKLIAKDQRFAETNLGKRWGKLLEENGNLGPIVREWASLIQDPDYKQELSPEFRINVFRDAANSADRHNDPGVFTAFIGYEWTQWSTATIFIVSYCFAMGLISQRNCLPSHHWTVRTRRIYGPRCPITSNKPVARSCRSHTTATYPTG